MSKKSFWINTIGLVVTVMLFVVAIGFYRADIGNFELIALWFLSLFSYLWIMFGLDYEIN